MNKIMCKLINIDSGNNIEWIKINIQLFWNLGFKLLNFGSYVPKSKIFWKKKPFQNVTSEMMFLCSKLCIFVLEAVFSDPKFRIYPF
jgi:hypothetical protein